MTRKGDTGSLSRRVEGEAYVHRLFGGRVEEGCLGRLSWWLALFHAPFQNQIVFAISKQT